MSLTARLCVIVASIAMLAAAGCDSLGKNQAGSDTAPSPQRPRSDSPLVVAVVGDPSTFNPVLADGQAGRAVGGAVFDTLIRLDPVTAEVQPGLATKWKYNPESYEYTLALRDDVVWQDGEPFTARDVVFTVEAIHASPQSPYAPILRVDDEPIRASAVGSRAVRFALPRPYPPFLQSLVIPIVPAHKFNGDTAAPNPEAIAGMWGVESPVDEIVGTGPFRIESYDPGQRVVLARNPRYWRRDGEGVQLPYLDRYVLRVAETRDIARDWFMAGAIHIFSPRFDEVRELTTSPSAHEFVIEDIGPDTGSLFLTFNRNPLHYRKNNVTDPRFAWFNDRRFLAAIAHAIDKEEIITRALNGMGIPAISLIPPANPFCDLELRGYDYDPELARETLDDAGYRDRNNDGVRDDVHGKPIEFSLATNQGNKVREQIAKLVITQLAAVGIKVTLQTLPFPDLFERLDATYNWDAMLIGFTGGIDPVSSENLLRSSGELHVWNPLQEKPATNWEAEIDDLLDQGNREMDSDRRHEIYREIQEILNTQLPMIQLVRLSLFAAHRLEVEHFQPSPWGFHEIEELRLRPRSIPSPVRPTPAGD